MSARLLRLALEGFRGFAERQEIDLDADAIVVRGDNGTGKTSLVDGLLWLFTGELTHLTQRVRGLRRTEDAITSRFNPDGAMVSLTLSVNGVEMVVTRTGDQSATRLMVDGDEERAEDRLAAALGTQDLKQAVVTWGLLRQDAIRSALDQAGGALHERVSGLIGLERVSAFATAATRASDALVRSRTGARSSRAAAAHRHEDALARVEIARQAADSDVGGAITAGLTDLGLAVPAGADLALVEQLGAQAGQIVEALGMLKERRRALDAFPEDVQQLVDDAEAASADAERAAAVSAERAPALVQLATSAMGLLGERCPVCDQTIDEASVRSHLEEVLARSRALAAEVQANQDALARARMEFSRLRSALTDRRAAEMELHAAEAEAVALVGEIGDLDELLEHHQRQLTRLRQLYRTVNQASGAEVARLSDEAAEAERALRAADEELALLEARCERANELQRAAHEAAEAILETALSQLQPSFAEVFDRLAPNPAFTELLARQDVMRNRNQIVPLVRDRERGIDANPLLVFSEGQLNVVALSYFLGMALNARDAALPFLVLDDPLQALDVIAILGFSDLCRQIRDRRQLLVTTHDRRFADVLVRKLSPRDSGQTLLVHHFTGWTREGPVIATERPEIQPVMWLLRGEAS